MTILIIISLDASLIFIQFLDNIADIISVYDDRTERNHAKNETS